MSKLVMEMMALGVAALRTRDNSNLGRIYEMEEMVDVLFRKNLRESSQLIRSNNYSDNRCNISTALILKYLERISDHACYIADSVNYIETGMASPRR